jgi:hypothetical protein
MWILLIWCTIIILSLEISVLAMMVAGVFFEGIGVLLNEGSRVCYVDVIFFGFESWFLWYMINGKIQLDLEYVNGIEGGFRFYCGGRLTKSCAELRKIRNVCFIKPYPICCGYGFPYIYSKIYCCLSRILFGLTLSLPQEKTPIYYRD